MSLPARSLVVALSALPVLFLAGCGQGWEQGQYERVPYTMERTAGHGIAYVRAKLMPARGPSVVVQEEAVDLSADSLAAEDSVSLVVEEKAPLYTTMKTEPKVEPVSADSLFEKAQRK
ncbi:MAG: hypothetical protein KDJ15_05285 [Alphaproteobacteria bacterium]|nr:hypothetical protein [Alphaproteobacteria bacterium]